MQKINVIRAASIAKLVKNGNVTTDILLKLCLVLDCSIEDIMGDNKH
ncbi:helix-turn-helix domain-containing protein [Limosilactobacillus reuteri]